MKTKQKSKYVCLKCKKEYVRYNSLLDHFVFAHKFDLNNRHQRPKQGKHYVIRLGISAAVGTSKKDKAGVKDLPKAGTSRNAHLRDDIEAAMDDYEAAPKSIQKAVELITQGMWNEIIKLQIRKSVGDETADWISWWNPMPHKPEDAKGTPYVTPTNKADYLIGMDTPDKKAHFISHEGWPDFAIMPHTFDELWQVIDLLAQQANEHNFNNIMEFAFHLTKEEAVMLVRRVFSLNPDLACGKCFIKWATANQKFLLNYEGTKPCNKYIGHIK